VLVATRWLRVTPLRVGLPELPEEWRGLRVALLTDFHAGGRQVRLDTLRRAKRIALDFEPDLIVLGGDFFDEGRRIEVGDLFTCWPRQTPVFAVTGNHDYRGGSEHLPALIAELEAHGVTFLQNEAIKLKLKERCAWIAGVDDAHTRHDDVGKALAKVPLDEPPLLLISHSPSALVNMPAGGARLIVAGHTHGGQLRVLPSGRLPFVTQIRLLRGLPELPPLPAVRGQHWFRGAVVVISDGLGQSTLGARFRTRPEVVLIELVQAPEQADEPCDDARRYVTYRGDEPRILRWLT
jgi:predicted MPP superfamily phosphohydrolase